MLAEKTITKPSNIKNIGTHKITGSKFCSAKRGVRKNPGGLASDAGSGAKKFMRR
jgi:hypothetical protein